MRIAIFGAGGWVGGTVVREALSRGHAVTVVVRDPTRQLKHERVEVATADATDAAQVASAVAGHAVVASISGRRDANHAVVPAAARALLAGLAQAGIKRLLWVGGAGSLEVARGVRLIDTPQFPAEVKPESAAAIEALQVFRDSTFDDVQWSYLSPPAMLEAGQRTGRYRTGGDQLLKDEKGESRISVEDYAVALVDELERPAHIRQRFTVAY